MEPTPQNLELLSHYLGQTLDNDRKVGQQAEHELGKLAEQPGFSLVLLTLLQQAEVPVVLAKTAAVHFKNFVKQRWHNGTDEEGVPENDRNLIKTHIVDLLSTAMGVISDNDFPDKWDTLLPEMIEKLATDDYDQINGVLRTLSAIIRKFRTAFASDIEDVVVYVVKMLCEPLLELFLSTMKHIKDNVSAVSVLTPLLRAVLYMLKLFVSINYVTLPQLIEDHLDEWMSEFQWLLRWTPTGDASALMEHPDFDTKPGLLPKTQALVCDAITLFIHRYEEEFEPYLQPFVMDSWQLLTRSTVEEREDRLVIAAMAFLQTVSTSVHHALFNDEEALKGICENVVIPNITLRDVDCEMFEDNPDEYIKRDIEGSDSDTRRRSACELVKGLRKHYEEPVSNIFTAYINLLLQQHAEDADNGWRHKDAAIYLVTALSVTTSTQKRGASRTNPFVQVLDFYTATVLPELVAGAEAPEKASAGQQVLQSDALRFSSVFRQTLDADAYLVLTPLFVSLLRSPCAVVHTYAAGALENFLKVKDDGAPRLPNEALHGMLAPMIGNLCALLPGGQMGVRENTYVIRALMRVVTTAKEAVLEYCGELLQQLVVTLELVAANPLNAHFNHFLFETVAALIKIVTSSNADATASFEGVLFPLFQKILGEDVSEFAPYVFQLLAQLLEVSPAGVSEPYETLLPPLLNAVLWERMGNVPPLVRLLQAYARRGPSVLAQHIEPTLGVFQQLIARRSTDHEAFFLLESLTEFLPPTVIAPHLTTIFQLIFHRLKHSKTNKFVKSFVIFLALFFGKHDPSAVADAIDSVDANIFSLVLDKIWLPNAMKVTGDIERKTVALGSIAMLSKCEPLFTTYVAYWPRICESLIGLLELAPQEDDDENDEEQALASEPAFHGGASFNALHYAARGENDPFADVPSSTDSLRVLLVQGLASSGKPVGALVSQMDEQCVSAVQQYCQQAGVQLE